MILRIRNLRKNHGHTQKEIAALLHISQATYSCYECGHLKIPPNMLLLLADHYQTSVDYLLGRTNVFQPYPKP